MFTALNLEDEQMYKLCNPFFSAFLIMFKFSSYALKITQYDESRQRQRQRRRLQGSRDTNLCCKEVGARKYKNEETKEYKGRASP